MPYVSKSYRSYLIDVEIFYKWLEMRENTHAAYFSRYNNIQTEDIFFVIWLNYTETYLWDHFYNLIWHQDIFTQLYPINYS